MKVKVKAIIFIIATIITYFLFEVARAAAIAERGTDSAIGGEYMLWLLPFIAVMAWDNLLNTRRF